MVAVAPTDRNVRIGLIQAREQGSYEANLATTIDKIREAAAGGAQIICTQELFTSPYFCRTQDTELFDLAEPIPGPTTDALAAVAGELGVVIIGSLFERRASGVYHNTAAVIDADGTYLGKYRKMHIPQDPGFEETFSFTPGDLGYKVWDTRFGKISVLICWDQWYPEAARLAALAGAEILFYPTAIGWLPEERPNSARHSTLRGKPCNVGTPWPTVATWLRSIALALRVRLSFGGNLSSPIFTDKSCSARLWTPRLSSLPTVI